MEKEIEGIKYRFGKLDAFQQFHLMRRLAPLLTSVGNAFQGRKPSSQDDILNLIVSGMMDSVAHALATMSDEDSNYILFTCLRVVERQQGDAWARLMPVTGNSMMFQISLPVMFQIVAQVIKENLGNFLPALGLNSDQAGRDSA